jgi:TolB-like protein
MLQAGSRLGRYEILGPLGAGGMGEVYRARDPRLDREVAVKVLPASFAQDSDRLRRFEQEARAAGALSHPGILSVFDIDTHDGAPYLVSELLEGETLRSRLAGTALAPRRAIEYALQTAQGLAAAHEKGIVHRDLKPDNLFVTKDGRVKILDFGLAKLTQPASASGSESNPTMTRGTDPGTVLGTVGYMSPEQVRGKATDHRSDIFALGTILYEMLTGRRAFKGDTAAETMTAILKEEPPEISATQPSVSPGLERVVRHCLEKDPESRFQSVHDVAFALQEAATGAVTSGAQTAASTPRKNVLIAAALSAAFLLAVAGVFVLKRPHEGVREVGAPKRLAVLPFENLGAAEDAYFADGMTDEVRSKLSGLPGLTVIARASADHYKGSAQTAREIAKELGVRYLLTAKVRWQKSGTTSRIRLTPELADVSGDVAVTKWQAAFDADLEDVFQVQAEIATKVAESLAVALGAREKERLGQQPTLSLAAWDAYVKGQEIEKRGGLGGPSLRLAVSQYERAAALDPAFALAWARLSSASSVIYFNGISPPGDAEVARKAAEQAFKLSPELPEAFVALGHYHAFVTKDYARAVNVLSQGLRIAPTNVELYSGLGLVDESLGRWQEALGNFKHATELDPFSWQVYRDLAESLVFLRLYGEAREVCDRGLGVAPANLDLIQYKAMTYLGGGELQKARAVPTLVPKEVDERAIVAYLAYQWDLLWVLDETRREVFLRLTPGEFDEDRGTWGLAMAQAYALRGEKGKVREYAEQARRDFVKQSAEAPNNATQHALLGLALAYLGRGEEAVLEGERGAALLPIAKDAFIGPYIQHQVLRIHIILGHNEKALDLLEPLLRIPYLLSPGWLKIDPNFDRLRGNPRFEKLVTGSN